MINKIFKKGEKFYHATMQIDGIADKNFCEIRQMLYNRSKKHVNQDWGNALYTSQNVDVARGYILPDGAIGCIIELEASEDISCLSSEDEIYASTSCGQCAPESTKREVCKLLGEEVIGPFMTFLGNNGYVFECYHDSEGGKEVIIPSCMVQKFAVVSVTYLKYNTREFCCETLPNVENIGEAHL